jgi:hypothetical protein
MDHLLFNRCDFISVEFTFGDEMMDYQTVMILQQQQEFLAAAAANPFNVLHNAAAGSSSSRPNLVDVLANLNGGIAPSSSEPQTPMGLLQKFFLDASNNANANNRTFNDLSTTPPTPPTPRDISIGKKIVESLTHQDINALLKLSGSEHDDDDDDDDDDNENNGNNMPSSMADDTDDEIDQYPSDDDSNDPTNRAYEGSERLPMPVPARITTSSNLKSKHSSMETLILPSFNRCTHLGKSTKRSAGLERMFPSFSKQNLGPSSTLSLILYGLSSTS